MITNDALKSKNQLLVEVFMSKMHSDTQHVPVCPTVPDIKTRHLRAHLMLEETLETIRKGLGLDLTVTFKEPKKIEGETTLEGCELTEDNCKITFREIGPANLIEIADGCCDVEVVNTGTASACGIALQPCFEAVSGNNLFKFAPGHYFNSYGKLCKPPGHPEITPYIKSLLIQQGMK